MGVMTVFDCTVTSVTKRVAFTRTGYNAISAPRGKIYGWMTGQFFFFAWPDFYYAIFYNAKCHTNTTVAL